MTGGIVALVIGLWERWRGTQIVRRKYAWILAVILFVACFLAWKDEHAKVLAHSAKTRFRIERILAGPTNPTDSISISFWIECSNSGEPTGLFQWKLRTLFPDGTTMESQAVHVPGKNVFSPRYE
jgi:hypothetical protein